MVDRSKPLRQARHDVKMGSARVVATLLGGTTLVIGSILGFAWRFVDQVATSVSTHPVRNVPMLASPILSARHFPQTLSDEVRVSAVRRRLVAVANTLPEGSCLAVDVEGKRLVEVNPTVALIPASNMKLVTAYGALKILGADYTFNTSARGVVDGTQVVGDLVIVGGGDPVLVTADYPAREFFPTFNQTKVEDLVDAIVARGITNVTGSIVGDESRYDTERYSPNLGLGIRGTEVGPLGALMISDGTLATSPIKPDQPALAAATELTRLLVERGVTVGGEPRVGLVGADQGEIASVVSQPLRNIVAEMLTNSDNNTAELLLKEIGFVSRQSGTRESGIGAVIELLGQDGLAIDGLVMNDGSGLDRDNRISCGLLMQILASDGGFADIGNGLSILGQTGTLRDVLSDSPVAGRLYGKTGTLTDVKTLSGFVRYSETSAATFALLLNGRGVSNQGAYRPIWNALALALGSVSASPTAADLAP
jgi:D-alanyl-D-alanine carboxypeptidase/D-alanyl-D-alanine-endopeptidase (penicillin-binding protein 4)